MSRGDVGDVRETPDKTIAKTPEKRINTFDDFRTIGGEKGVRTFDDMRKPPHERSINTFDDLRAPNDGGDKNTTNVADDHHHNTPEMVEQRRIDQAADGIRNLERMKPEQWKCLSIDDKRMTLQSASRELGRAYNSPEPPIETRNMSDPRTKGGYGDGQLYDARKGEMIGPDYGTTMNENGITRDGGKGFASPKEGLRTCAHEFRHSYQNEQAHAYQKGFRVDDSEKARVWSENFRNYKYAPNSDLERTDPDRYHREFDEYWNQPVEVDARDFGDKVVSRTYDDTRERL